MATPHDVTGPPIDIAVLAKRKELEEQERELQRELQQGSSRHRLKDRTLTALASNWADG